MAIRLPPSFGVVAYKKLPSPDKAIPAGYLSGRRDLSALSAPSASVTAGLISCGTRPRRKCGDHCATDRRPDRRAPTSTRRGLWRVGRLTRRRRREHVDTTRRLTRADGDRSECVVRAWARRPCAEAFNCTRVKTRDGRLPVGAVCDDPVHARSDSGDRVAEPCLARRQRR